MSPKQKTTAKTSATTEDTALAQQYQRKTDKQHILDNPDTYIGSVENVDSEMWTYNDLTNRIELNTIRMIPGLYKLFDEGIVNCRDHVIRMLHSNGDDKRLVSYIDIKIIHDEETSKTEGFPIGTIIMENDGNGIDVAKHPEYDVWIPEMIFAQLRTSTNYNKEEKRIVGGKNGFGFKLVLIWSSFGSVETVDHIRGLKYFQRYSNNLDVITPPVITKVPKTTKPYTRVVFTPDYRRFGLSATVFAPELYALFKKRVYDIGAVTDQTTKKLKVSFNGTQISIKNFQQYVDLYVGTKEETKRIYETANERWEYAVALSSTHEFIQVSFVNGIATMKGGKHVEYILGQITRKLADYIEKKKKVKVNANSIKEQLHLFIRCDIENPAFDSQTKDYMNTPVSKFGSSCNVSDAFIEKIAKMGVMELACSLTEAKETRMAKKTDGTKTKTIRGIANFIDANFAGTPKSKDCILILCEGLSAMTGIISGLSSEDRNTIGIYPLKGKVLNVRGETVKKVNENKEITDIKKIMGLETGKKYKNMDDVNVHLRYGKIMYMTDSDLDGHHIKALCINLFHSEWSSLVRIPGFLSFMNTPILRAKKGNQTALFYNEGEYNTWKNSIPNGGVDWIIKYYKGLGTSTSTEFKEYFSNKKIVDFIYTENVSDENIDKVFNKKRADDRKTWLEQYDKNSYLDTTHSHVKYEDFIDKELIHFSTYDCQRSIPNMVDGLKISLRKILFCAFKRNLTAEVKVAQFSGYVSEHSMYHHGEASLNGAIVNMAQTFVGSNNINLLEPIGQFGSRNLGGNDSASERYIFTHLNPLTRALFHPDDLEILTYVNDDGTMVEPEFYCPIIPFVLINGISGIGTGFSCNIPSFNPLQIIQYLKHRLTDTSPEEPDGFIPYYEGFKGTVERIGPHKFIVKGVYRKIDDETVLITELPVGTWTMPYITFLEELVDGGVDKNGKKIEPKIKDFVNLSTELSVNIKIIFPKGQLEKLLSLSSVATATSSTAEADENDDDMSSVAVTTPSICPLEKLLKLTTTVSMTNMYLFDSNLKLHKYENAEEIIDAFYGVRIQYYEKRKNHLIGEMEKKLVKLNNRARYIQLNLSGEIDLRRKSNVAVNQLLDKLHFVKLSGGQRSAVDDGGDVATKTDASSYDYLIKMPMNSVTDENATKILRERDDNLSVLERIRSTSLTKMWLNDITELETKYLIYKKHRQQIQTADTSTAVSKTKTVRKTGGEIKKMK